MAKSKSGKSYVNYEFVRFELSRQQKQAFASSLPPDMARVWDCLQALILDGHKVSLSHDTSNTCYIASLTCNVSVSRPHNHHAVLTARAKDLDTALALLVYKDDLLDGHWPLGLSADYDFG